MDLKELRDQIDSVDSELLELFQKRMDLCLQVADYKKKNSVSVLQTGREQQIIDRIKEMSEDRFEDSAAVLFSNIMDISKSYQQCEINKGVTFVDHIDFSAPLDCKVGCYGTKGSNSEEATKWIFGNRKKIEFYREFEDLFRAVQEGTVDFGIVPVQNSSTGSITAVYDLMRKYKVYINRMVRINIRHCLASANADSVSDVEAVYSHSQAIMQCSEFLRKNDLKTIHYASTATAAKYVSKSDRKLAAICSEKCARIYGLKVLQSNISDEESNFTRFVCIARDPMVEKDANRVSVIMSLSDDEGSLYRMLTKFRVAGLNLLRIESRPRHQGNFDVVFYLDFEGSVDDERVNALLVSLQNELKDFRFLGNYSEDIE
ncbi:chorismate mutase [Ruminococcus sp. HUN007]|uniref:chorismate mutase n=1 Tax=Ruminococcus sp. HUN007 TaxID=1514668 RepID=UPI0005D1CD69|nr:chorismate mutase [Ruminococcus sp. HUN007]